jgi:hypothetical protein
MATSSSPMHAPCCLEAPPQLANIMGYQSAFLVAVAYSQFIFLFFYFLI